MAAGVIENISGLVWEKGYAYGTINGLTQDAIAFGALQSVELNDAFDWVMLRGPESLSPIGVGLGAENLTGSFEAGVVTPEQFIMALGGSQAYNVGTDTTTYTKLVNQEPTHFNLRLKSDLNNPQVTINLYRCLCNNWKIKGGSNRQWSLGGGSFQVFGQAGETGVLFDFARPGNYTNAS